MILVGIKLAQHFGKQTINNSPIPKKGKAKNAQTTAQLHASHTLAK